MAGHRSPTSRDACQGFVHSQQHGMGSRSTTDSFVFNAVVSDNMPYESEHGFDNSQKYTAFNMTALISMKTRNNGDENVIVSNARLFM